MTISATHPITIVVVDDDPGHGELIRRNLHRAAGANPVVIINSGDDALDFIYAKGPHAGRPGDDRLLILLDINMPGGINGLDVLRHIKADPRTQSMPVIVLTSTDDPAQITRCYELGCNVYITKPVDPRDFVEAIRRIGLFAQIVKVAAHHESTR